LSSGLAQTRQELRHVHPVPHPPPSTLTPTPSGSADPTEAVRAMNPARQREWEAVIDAITDAVRAALPGLIRAEVAKQLGSERPTRIEDVPDDEQWLRGFAFEHLRARADTHFNRVPTPARETPP
jgi:hypothetical protein